MYKRPQRGESEEDLLKLQEEFFRNKAEQKLQPAAKFVSANVTKKEEEAEEKNIFQKYLSNTFEEIPVQSNIGCVVEKVRENIKSSSFAFSKKTGFPTASRRKLKDKPTSGSIFSQQIKRSKIEDKQVADTPTIAIDIRKQFLPDSCILTGKDKDEIHQESIQLLSKMSEKEIEEERETLLATTDPAIIAFLKSRRQQLQEMACETTNEIEEQKRSAENLKVEDISSVTDVLMLPKAEKWIHFDKLETSKLAWMNDINMQKEFKKEGYEARFDLAGWLLPYEEKEMCEKSRILYHHGDEPTRPGYTLKELFQLSRSNVMQQKVTALNSIANVLSLETSGVYDDIIDLPLEQVFFILRFCLDDNTPFVLNAAVKAVRNLFYYPIDEASIDSLLMFGIDLTQPTLCSEGKDVEDDETVNDQQLAELNLVKCLARTEIFTRIRYIINTVKPPIETISYVLDILIRLSRDSFRIASKVFTTENLIASVLKHFVPKVFKESVSNLNYGIPLRQAIKLCRILSTRSKKFANEFVDSYNVMESITIYLSNEHFSSNTTGVQLQIECLHLWTVLVTYGFTFEHFSALEPVLMQMLLFHYNKTNLDTTTSYNLQGHFAALLNLFSAVSVQRCTLITPYLQVTTDIGLQKWITQFNLLNSFLCGKLLIISSLLNFLSNIIQNKTILHAHSVCSSVKSMVNSSGFSLVTSNIRIGSNVLCPHEVHKPSKNLISMEASVWNTSEHIVPVLQTNSCMPFLCCLSKFVECCDDNQLKLTFLNHKNIQKYLGQLKDAQKYNLSSNWFTRVEAEFIMNLLKISYAVNCDIDTAMYYVVAVKCLHIFNGGQKNDIEFVFKNLIFNKNYYPDDALLRNLNISSEYNFISDCLPFLDDIFQTYIEVLGLKTDVPQFCNDLSMDVKVGTIIPIDWIYSPIVVLYANSLKTQKGLSEEKVIFIVSNCLRWIYIYESYFSELSMLINPTDKYCRLACVFLASDDIFFVPEVHKLLEENFKHFIQNDLIALDFKKNVHGLSNFQDFYTQLLEQYQGVSYGNPLFTNFILIPLMQKANVQYRKLLWSEYEGITQICNITLDKLMYPIDIFLEPTETDMSLLKCYRRFIVGRPVPEDRVLKIICRHHLDTYIKNKNLNM